MTVYLQLNESVRKASGFTWYCAGTASSVNCCVFMLLQFLSWHASVNGTELDCCRPCLRCLSYALVRHVDQVKET